jgi:hypothetical protein
VVELTTVDGCIKGEAAATRASHSASERKPRRSWARGFQVRWTDSQVASTRPAPCPAVSPERAEGSAARDRSGRRRRSGTRRARRVGGAIVRGVGVAGSPELSLRACAAPDATDAGC